MTPSTTEAAGLLAGRTLEYVKIVFAPLSSQAV